MPELAEVETVARGLRRLVGRRVTGVRFGKTDFIRHPEHIKTLLPGSRIGEIRRQGKLLLVALDRKVSEPERLWLLIHLGMTGQLVVHHPVDPVRPHTHVRVSLDDGSELRYVDIRRFGHIRIASPEEMEAVIAPLGADPLEVTGEEFRARLGSRRARVKALLLDQRVLRGMGNIYTDESLWRACLHPARLGSELTTEELDRLWRATGVVLRDAIRRRGTSIANYVDARGRRGTNQKWLCVYRRLGLPCSRCGRKIERAIVAGRSSYFCPRCQPASATGRSGRPGAGAGNPRGTGRR
ncbi:MAG TPA: bifunctional DNA-formamidopyrimidine glycosylase/DNA-(apurinic or apyrimidinic site) lyase [Candidatus Dormibacteraeota bacterium]|nr:bifunctional DNA-formamidopyrimidine glycosylase/DNA-(apurinic or apyrimidinic site) lyase [Candidatus Dormibacteraeota bacterium]